MQNNSKIMFKREPKLHCVNIQVNGNSLDIFKVVEGSRKSRHDVDNLRSIGKAIIWIGKITL